MFTNGVSSILGLTFIFEFAFVVTLGSKILLCTTGHPSQKKKRKHVLLRDRFYFKKICIDKLIKI